MSVRRPHPIPYQGSKRRLADAILEQVRGRSFRRFFEPFGGSAAMTLAAADAGLANAFVLGESLAPLADIWRQILASPTTLADDYRRLWEAQHLDPRLHFSAVRAEFNAAPSPAHLLYLLARCVKNSPRFNPQGEFNQSADHRRRGTRPDKLREEVLGASRLLAGRTIIMNGDYVDTLTDAGPDDLVYLDPPWEGTTTGRDKRYHQGLGRPRLVEMLAALNRRQVPFLLSYDGRCGAREYGEPLPEILSLRRVELAAGRSSQSTLSGRDEVTVESLYLSPSLAKLEV